MEKTLQELQAELDAIKKHNVEVELAMEQEKETKRLNELAKQAEKQKEEELVTRIEANLKEKLGIKAVSKIGDDSNAQTSVRSGNPQFKSFIEGWAKDHGVEPKSYADFVHNFCNGAKKNETRYLERS
jgi:predicted ATP-grasp superfamily ATP-dependent carboligase